MKITPLLFHKKLQGKIEVVSRKKIRTREDLSLAYTPGVADPCREIAKDVSKVYAYTRKSNMVAVVTDGSAVLGLGNIGPEASLPVMEGKAVLFKEFGNVDAFPIALTTQDPDEIIETVVRISPMFGGINLEDIAAPACFYIEEELNKRLSIPVFHDDQHGTAIVVLGGLYNALKVTKKKIDNVRVVINGAGAAGIAIAKLLLSAGVKHIFLVDSTGIIFEGRENLTDVKKEMAKCTNAEKRKGSLEEAIAGSDVFIGVSRANVLSKKMVKSMNDDAIIFAMANPIPEIMPNDALSAGATVVATGRSDFPNQINNVLVFPGIFRGLLDARMDCVTNAMKIDAAKALARYVKKPTAKKIIPSVFDKGVAQAVARAVKKHK
ncbi:MAG: NAD-dependent malic enzyme [Candidatus Magasanikbacteria bacterium CG11_big_fil_rev_8_21_14_0_20_39_34]|uniref:NAD-dependent malic enzyme n=1 Tax=Candidatus Magasanikbacteria bacterium CG11_big_fil_rev_8_21_14_0_20_39_34 TaxID=1974653 RepID=A0A2H0N3N5_9BACT|nr:MAG: NAD-dependent malic enzyme [Candidatus Magasanikbacteria bacterium CG11_big_fil_rev_8_21_14_0_20_39_34]